MLKIVESGRTVSNAKQFWLTILVGNVQLLLSSFETLSFCLSFLVEQKKKKKKKKKTQIDNNDNDKNNCKKKTKQK